MSVLKDPFAAGIPRRTTLAVSDVRRRPVSGWLCSHRVSNRSSTEATRRGRGGRPWTHALRSVVPLGLLLGASATTQAAGQQVLAQAPSGYRVGVSGGSMFMVRDPYQCGTFGVGMDLVIGRSLGAGWLISVGGHLGEHYVQDNALLQPLHFGGAFGEVRKYHPAQAAQKGHAWIFNGARVGYLRTWGPGLGARGDGGEVTAFSGVDVGFSGLLSLEVAGYGALQLVDGAWGSQFSLQVGLAMHFGGP